MDFTEENLGKDTMDTTQIIHEVAYANVGKGRGYQSVKIMDAKILEKALAESLNGHSEKPTEKFFLWLHRGLIQYRNRLVEDTPTDSLKEETFRDYEESVCRLHEIARKLGITYKEPPDTLPEEK